MRYTLAVGTVRGEELLFPHYGENEYLLALSIARHQSQNSLWAEVREPDGEVRCRYVRGRLIGGSGIDVWRDDRLSHQRQNLTRMPLPDRRWD